MTDASSKYQDSLPVSSDALLDQLRQMGVEFEYYEHPPLRTVEDSKLVQGTILPDGPGRMDFKNLYLRDRKKRNSLVVLEQDAQVDLRALGDHIGGRLSFGSPDRLMEHLGVRPGAVSPLAMVTGAEKGVKIYLDTAIQQAEILYYHPLVNDRTVGITPKVLTDLLNHWGAVREWLDPLQL